MNSFVNGPAVAYSEVSLSRDRWIDFSTAAISFLALKFRVHHFFN